MKKPYPLGNKLDQLINEAVDDFNDVPNLDFDGEYKTQVPIAGLPKGGYGYSRGDSYNEDKTSIIIPKKKKRKFIDELPPKENLGEEPDIEFQDEDGEEIEEQKEIDEEDFDPETIGKKKSPGSQQPEQDPNAMIDPGGTGGVEEDPNSAPEGEDPNSGGMDPNMGGDPNAMGGMGGTDPSMGGMGGDPNAMGMGMEPPPKTAEEIGRIFELKKIYARLLAVEEHLSFSADDLLLKLREFVSKAIELFETLISNVDSYKDQLDDIIIMFYKFLDYVYDIMNRYYKVKEKEDQKQQDKTKLFTKFPKDDGKSVSKHGADFMFKAYQ